MFQFKKSLRAGQAGEELFLKLHPSLKRLDGYRGDFINNQGEKIELKTDSYCLRKSKNFFFERFSNRDKRTPGGPWQALEHGNTWFVYLFKNNLCSYRFKTDTLVKYLNELIHSLPPVNVVNESWTTEGYKVPRKALYDITEEIIIHHVHA